MHLCICIGMQVCLSGQCVFLCIYVRVWSSSELPQGYIHSFWWLQTCRRAEQSPSWETLNYNALTHTLARHLRACAHTLVINLGMHVWNKKCYVSVGEWVVFRRCGRRTVLWTVRESFSSLLAPKIDAWMERVWLFVPLLASECQSLKTLVTILSYSFRFFKGLEAVPPAAGGAL